MKPYTQGMAESTPDPVMARVRELFERSKMTLEEVATRMGYTGTTGRQSVWQFINKTVDPRMSMVRKFAQAVGVSLSDLCSDQKKGPSNGAKKAKS
jgi:transcriptional regulator with XRE-family HTH domain